MFGASSRWVAMIVACTESQDLFLKRHEAFASWHCQVGQGGKTYHDASKTSKDNSEEACGAKCTSESDCLAFDYTTKSAKDACRLFSTTIHRDDGGDADRRYCTLDSPSPTPVPPTPVPLPLPLPAPLPAPSPSPSYDWDCYVGKNTDVGEQDYKGGKTLDKCKAACEADSDCRAIGWHMQKSYCSLRKGEFEGEEFLETLKQDSSHESCFYSRPLPPSPPPVPPTPPSPPGPARPWLTEDGEDTGLPLYWNWCEEGYCSEIKHQYGGSCLNNAKISVLETHVHMLLHYNKSYPNKPPQPVKTFSLQQYNTCSNPRKDRVTTSLGLTAADSSGDYGITEWVKTEGVYSEEDWPQKGDYHTCSMARHGRDNKGCWNSSCLIAEGLHWENHHTCKDKWGVEQYQKAIDNNDPCECAGNSHLDTWKVPGVIEQFRDDCRRNFAQQSYDPCFCNVMIEKGVKPLYTGEELQKMDIWRGLSGIGHITGVGNDTVAEARWLRQTGPASRAISGFSKHAIVTDKDWATLKKNCWGGDGHVVNFVGWNRQGPVPYWIIRNSWGPLYNDHGFIYQNMDCKKR